MNERIEELALQTGAIKCHGYIDHPELDGYLIWAADAVLDTKKMDAAKFAELIVRECQTVVERAISVDFTIDRVPVLIKEHFGVKRMKDVTGKDLAVGDQIVLIPQNGYTCSLSMGIITGFTAKKVKIQLTDKAWSYSADKCLKFPEQVAKV